MTAVSFAFIESWLDWGRWVNGYGVLVHLLRGQGNGEWCLGKKCYSKVTKVTLSLIILPRLEQVPKKGKDICHCIPVKHIRK